MIRHRMGHQWIILDSVRHSPLTFAVPPKIRRTWPIGRIVALIAALIALALSK